MKIVTTFLCACLFTQFLIGQKIIRKTIINPETQAIQIDAENCHKIVLETSKNKALFVEVEIEGEYQKDLAVKIEEDGSNVYIGVGYLPNFVNLNDKLSAHETISIALKITIPEYSYVTVVGTDSTLEAKGTYKTLKISSATGACRLNNVTANVEVKTQKGIIAITALEGFIEAESVYGMVEQEKIPEGNSNYKLFSVEGNIYVKKTE